LTWHYHMALTWLGSISSRVYVIICIYCRPGSLYSNTDMDQKCDVGHKIDFKKKKKTKIRILTPPATISNGNKVKEPHKVTVKYDSDFKINSVHHHSSLYTTSTSTQFLPPATQEITKFQAIISTLKSIKSEEHNFVHQSWTQQQWQMEKNACKQHMLRNLKMHWMTTIEENLELPLYIRGNPGKWLSNLCSKFWK